MQIIATKKLLNKMGVEPTSVTEESQLCSWRANILEFKEIKDCYVLVLMCTDNRYTVALYGLKSKDFKNIKELNIKIITAIKNTLLKQHINPLIIDKYISQLGEITYTNDSDRSGIAQLNKSCDEVWRALYKIEDYFSYSDNIAAYANKWCYGKKDREPFFAVGQMIEDLAMFGIDPVISHTALEMEVTLDLEGNDTVRRLIIASDTTFIELHKILQTAFGWKDYHLYLFGIGSKCEDHPSYIPQISLRPSDPNLEPYDEDSPIENVLVADYIFGDKPIVYNYDFGDDWVHRIKLIKQIDNYSGKSPICISGSGNAPPEDVGGAGGYEHLLEVLSNPNHEEYEHLKEWSDSAGYQKFDTDRINLLLSN